MSSQHPEDNPVLIVAPGRGSIRRALKRLKGARFSWIYLGPHKSQFREAQSSFEGAGSHLDTTDQFHQAGHDLKQPYLSYFYELGRKQNSLRWWITSLAQSNCYLCKTVHQVCYLKVGLDLAVTWEKQEPLVLVVADRPVREALRLNILQKTSQTLAMIGLFRPPALSWLRDLPSIIIRRTFFVIREINRLRQARQSVPRADLSAEPTTIIAAYVTPATVRRGSKFHESYFGDLATRLGQMGHRVAVMPIVLRDVPYKQALLALKDSSMPLVVPHRYLRPLDVIRAAISSIARPSVPAQLPALAGMDPTPLIKEELRGFRSSNWAADTLLTSALLQRWKAAGSSISQIIYVYENQPWERALCWETRRLFPETVLTGYQHARVPLLMLNFYLAEGGEPDAPKPDWVVTVGEHSAQLLANQGHGGSWIRPGGALQMQSNGAGSPPETASTTPEIPTVLVTTSNGIEEAEELVEMAVDLFDENYGVKILLKCHPLLPLEAISAGITARLPKHVEVSDEPVTELMRRSSLMVYSGSTVCIPALGLGLPLVHVRPHFDFDLDPLETVPDTRLDATNLAELRRQVRWLLEHLEEYKDQHRDEWSRLVDQMYGPVTDDTIRAFISQEPAPLTTA